MCGEQLCSTPTGKPAKWWLHVFVHPSIRATVRDLLSYVSEGTSSLEGPFDLQGGLVCFQLRRKKAPQCRLKGHSPSASCNHAASDLSFDWDKVCDTDELHALVPHLTTIPVQIPVNTKRDFLESNDSAAKNRALEHIESHNKSIRKWEPSEGPSAPRIGNGDVVLVSQCPCDPSLVENAAMCGSDILCHPSDARSIFQVLTVAGKACSIGVIEESLASLESEPPLPVFPRDYPDTEVGQQYWSGDSSEWQLLRQSLEQGWGRLRIKKDKTEKLQAVCWSHISTLPENASSSDVAPVVVRGIFGKPFVDALAGCGHLPPTQETTKRTRRPRRPVRPESTSVQLSRLTSEEGLAHENQCESLLASLSLPALVRCHVRMEGKGTVEPCGRIFVSMCDLEEQKGYIDYLLGTCVCGSFSMSRGSTHGAGFVGAARLLHVLGSEHGRLSCVAVNSRADGTKHVELKVVIKAPTSGSTERNSTISLLL